MQEVDIVLHNKPSTAVEVVVVVEAVAVVTGGDGSDGTRARIHRERIITRALQILHCCQHTHTRRRLRRHSDDTWI